MQVKISGICLDCHKTSTTAPGSQLIYIRLNFMLHNTLRHFSDSVCGQTGTDKVWYLQGMALNTNTSRTQIVCLACDSAYPHLFLTKSRLTCCCRLMGSVRNDLIFHKSKCIFTEKLYTLQSAFCSDRLSTSYDIYFQCFIQPIFSSQVLSSFTNAYETPNESMLQKTHLSLQPFPCHAPSNHKQRLILGSPLSAPAFQLALISSPSLSLFISLHQKLPHPLLTKLLHEAGVPPASVERGRK